jgi:16S rRNA (adenine1518-N6/adenine1519-N6)-dimethyltransferase
VNLDSVREVAQLLAERGLTPKKRWGQNFLVDRNVREAICAAVRAGSGEPVWEIGPGLGALTELLLERGTELTVFEIDYGLVSLLKEQFAAFGNVEIVSGDVLDTWPAQWSRGHEPVAVVGNLPYSAAATIIASFLEHELTAPQFLFMVQEEVADRMIAEPGTRAYSSFSVLVRSRLDVSRKMRIHPGSFYPKPEVSSALVELVPRPDGPTVTDASTLSLVARAVFHARRKTVANSVWQAGLHGPRSGYRLGRDEVRALLHAAEIDPAVRGETLAVDRIVALADTYARWTGAQAR